MKRQPYSSPKRQEPLIEEMPFVTSQLPSKWPRWLTTKQAATYLGKFRRKDGVPSEGAIRNMIYRKQLSAKKFVGRILIDRLQLDQLIQLSPQPGG